MSLEPGIDKIQMPDQSHINYLGDEDVFKESLDGVHCDECSIHMRPTGIQSLEDIQQKWKEENPKRKKVQKFYKRQDKLIDIFKEADVDRMEFPEDNDSNKKINLAAKLSFVLNLILFTAKLVAAIMSGSFSILSSVVDSAVDLICGIVIWYTNRAIKLANIYQYPIGRNRLEPLAVLVLSCIMAMASVLVIRESLGKIISRDIEIDLTIATIIIIVGTIIAKFFLFLFCRSIESPSTKLLALDHRNDVVSNTLALVFGVLGDYVIDYMDPIGAIILSLYVFISWWKQGTAQIRTLSGHVAPDWLLKKITWICLQHATKITGIDTINASSIGVNYLVEVHIVLPPETSLTEAHDIGESLQLKLESHDFIERAFVHVDYDGFHHPSSEHRPVSLSTRNERAISFTSKSERATSTSSRAERTLSIVNNAESTTGSLPT